MESKPNIKHTRIESKASLHDRLKLHRTDFAGGVMVMIRCPDHLVVEEHDYWRN